MALKRQRPGEIPGDAVVLDYDEALRYQLDLIHDWDKTSEAWPLRWGVSFLGVAASAAGLYINNHFRRKLRLRRIGLFTTYMPIVVMPGMATTLLHRTIITHNLLMESKQCPLCLQARAAALQVGAGFIYPLILSPLGNAMYATRHHTIRLPDIIYNFRGAIAQLVKFARPIRLELSLIFVAQLLLGSYFTYREAKSYYIIKKRMLEIEQEYDNRVENFEQ